MANADDTDATNSSAPLRSTALTGGHTGVVRGPSAARVVIATSDFVGPVRNGGIGTAYAALARTLTDAGHEVTVLYARDNRSEDNSVEYWSEHYGAQGIEFVSLGERQDFYEASSIELRRSHNVYQWLRQRDGAYDLVHFPDWKGLGYFTLLARHQGLAFAELRTCIGLHSPSLWSDVGNGRAAFPVDALITDYMERRSLELTDIAVSPSRYLVTWLRGRGWKLPEHTQVLPNLMNSSHAIDSKVSEPEERLEELVFFGRLEWRKGLVLFCEAVTALRDEGRLANVRITFLGKVGAIYDEPADRWIKRHAQGWDVPWNIIDTLNQKEALRYLGKRGRLAVVASLLDNSPYTVLECLHEGIPFITSKVGGISELLIESDVDRVCFPPTLPGICAMLASVEIRPPYRPRLSFDPMSNAERWLALHGNLPARRSQVKLGSGPLVSVCIPHRDRPEYLRQACASLAVQSYENFEVVIADDGSVKADTRLALDEIEKAYGQRGWRVLRLPHRGESATRNAAVTHSRGKYLMLMDDDNIAKPNEIETFVTAAEASNADILTCIVDSFFGDAPPNNAAPSRRWIPAGGALLPGMIKNCFGDTNCLVKRELFLQLGGFREDFGNFSKDWDFFVRAALAGATIDVVPEPLYWYRRHGAALTHRRSLAMSHHHILQALVAHDTSEVWPLAMVAQTFSRRGSRSRPALNSARLRKLLPPLGALAVYILRHPLTATWVKLPVFLSTWRRQGPRQAMRALGEFASTI